MESLIFLLGQNIESVEQFVDRHLGPVEKIESRAELLLDTLQAYLSHGQRPANTSPACGCCTDTVHNRLGEIERALGCTIEERSLELGLALWLRQRLRDGSIPQRAPLPARRAAVLSQAF